jgi:DNA invertase Pin-like site-specific DNA recombinase
MTQAAIYCRISKDREAEGLGVERQRADCEALAARLGWAVAGTFTDDDRSAYSGKPRPAYRDMLAAIEVGTVGAVLAWHPDRLHRSPRELEDFIDLIERHAAAVQTVTAGAYDLTTPTGRMQARIVGNVARFESEHRSERLRRKMDQLVADGQPHVGGTRPFGYRRVTGPDGRPTKPVAFDVVPEEAALILEATDEASGGSSPTGALVVSSRPTASPGSRARSARCSARRGWPDCVSATWTAIQRSATPARARLPSPKSA